MFSKYVSKVVATKVILMLYAFVLTFNYCATMYLDVEHGFGEWFLNIAKKGYIYERNQNTPAHSD